MQVVNLLHSYISNLTTERERELDWGRSDSEASSDRYTTTRAPEGELPRPAAKNAQPQPAKTDLAGGAKTAYT